MKTLLLRFAIANLLLLPAAHAATCGPYLGAGLGTGGLRTPGHNLFVSPGTVDRNGLSGRAFIGYNITRNIGIEGGIARYARSRYAAVAAGQTSSIRYYAETADLVGKVYIPMPPTKANIYVLAGVASFWEQIKFADAGIPTLANYAQPAPGQTSQRRGRPIYGAGISFDLNRHITVNAEYTQITSLGWFSTNPLAVPNAVLITGNVSYHFC